MFVMATAYSSTGSSPVKIRNLSPSGALIEGGVLPLLGDTLSLTRGSLTIVGEVVWRRDMRAGLKFRSIASVSEWLPKSPASSSQQKVDAIVQQVKSKGYSIQTETEDASHAANEVNRVRILLEALADDLADDSDIVIRFGSKLQALDLAAQMLGRLLVKSTRP